MSHLDGSAHAPAPSTISLTPSARRPIVRTSVQDHVSSPSSSVASLVSSSSSVPPALAIEDLPLVLTILLEADLRARASTIVSGLGEEGQAWVKKIAEMLDDTLELEADEDEEEDESERPLVKLKEALCCDVQTFHQGKSLISSLEILLLLDRCSSERILNHPLVSLAIESLWSCGRQSVPQPDVADLDSPPSLLQRWTLYLDGLCTPSRLHRLALSSRLIHLALTVSILLRPGAFVSESDHPYIPRCRSNWREVLWAIQTCGLAVESLSGRPAWSLALPTISLLLALFRSTFAYPVLCLALPLLFFSLLTPSAPSLAHIWPLRQAYLPLAAYGSLLLRRISKPVLLLLPILAAIFCLVTLSFGGDPWRLGFVYAATSKFSPGTRPLPPLPPLPKEEGVAPFSARLWLSITLALLLALTVLLGCSRLAQPPIPLRRSAGETGVEREDKWEEEWGVEAANLARLARVRAVQRWLVDTSRLSAPSSGEDGDVADDYNRRQSTSASSLLEAQPLLLANYDASTWTAYRPIAFPSPINLVPTTLSLASWPVLYVLYRSTRRVTVVHTNLRRAVDKVVWRCTASVLCLDLAERLGAFGKRVWRSIRSRSGEIRL